MPGRRILISPQGGGRAAGIGLGTILEALDRVTGAGSTGGVGVGSIFEASDIVSGTGTGSGGSTPTPTGTSGSLTAGSSFTVSGFGFGSQGPTILLVEDFEGNTAGSKISLTEPVIGAWSSFNSSNGYTASNVAAHTGTLSFNANDVNQITNGTSTQEAVNILNLSLGGSQTEYFMSYWVYTPNQQFVGAYSNSGVLGTPPSPGTFPTDSCWKMTWLQDSKNNISGPFNMCIPTYTGGGAFQVEGAQYGMLGDIGTSWFSFTSWNRIASWNRGAPSATGSQSSGFLQTLNSQVGMTTFPYGTAASNPLFQGSATEFANINFPGYTAVCNKSQLPLYDDIYIAVGAGSVARVEIGDAATYTACQHMTILNATAWADGSVTSNVPRSGLDFTGQAYAYVWNANGVVNSSGYPISTATPVFNYANFSSTSGLTYYGNSSPNNTGGTFQIIPANSGHVAEGLWYQTLLSTGPFTETFEFQFTPSVAAPSTPSTGQIVACLTFCIQNSTGPPGYPVDVGLQAVGDANVGGFGWYLNSGSTQYNDFTPGIAVKFDMNNGSSANFNYPSGGTPNSTGLYINAGPRQGFTPCNDLNPYGIDFWNGDTKSVTVVYDGTYLTMTIVDNGNSAQARFVWPIDISTILGSQSYFGFTAGCSGNQQVSVINWKHSSGINSRLATPTFSVTPGEYGSTQSVSLSGPSGAALYYTTNGLVPTSASTLYTGTAITVAANAVIQAVAVQSGFTDSYVATGAYQIGTSNYINFPSGFAANDGMILVGHSYLSGSQIYICDTNSDGIEVGATWWSAPVPVTSFTTTFQMTFSSAAADGLTFCIQNYYTGYNNTATVTNGSANISIPNNQLVAGQPLSFSTTVGNITAGTQYFVVSPGGVSGSNVQVTTTYNGAGTAITASSSGTTLAQIPANMANGPFAMGGSQGQMGYGSNPASPDPGIQNSVAIALDFYGGSGEVANSVGLYLNGQNPLGNQRASGLTFNGGTWNITIAYSGGTLTFSMVNASNSSINYSTSWSVNVPTIVGASSAYVGFTGGTGGAVANFILNSWTLAP